MPHLNCSAGRQVFSPWTRTLRRVHRGGRPILAVREAASFDPARVAPARLCREYLRGVPNNYVEFDFGQHGHRTGVLSRQRYVRHRGRQLGAEI